MNRWTRSPRIPARLSRWITSVRSVFHRWTQRYRRLQDAWFALSHIRRRRTVLLGLEGLEVRELLNASFDGLGSSALSADLMRLRNDLTVSAVALVNAAQSAQTNTVPMASLQSQWSRTWSVLTTDWNQTVQDFVQFEDAALKALDQEFNMLLGIVDTNLGIRPSSSAASQPPPTSPGQSPPSGSGSTSTLPVHPLTYPPRRRRSTFIPQRFRHRNSVVA